MAMNNKKMVWLLIGILLSGVSALAYLLTMESRGRYFKCDTEVYFEDLASQSKIEADLSLMLVSDNIGMLSVRGVLSKEGVNYNVNRKIYFNYTSAPYGRYYHLKKINDENYATVNTVPDALFNELIFENKQDFYLAITPVGNGGYELREMIFPVAVCASKRV
ncbi:MULTISPECIES: hypothetical protein [unclassified Serratia (in: enterobacteria)]|uniref:hypothetical protein n=1 Tax=unclassified Serratia (in: enterobacteria) TaxID=2647522 RepID=UPI00046956BF|nr:MULTISPECIES: hypothetical protein [unclassified Serratia (in: enterobacteria)]